MKYMLLIYENEAAQSEPTREELAAWFRYTNDLAAKTKLVGSGALKPTNTATTVRQKGGSMVTLDGPFAETKEQLGGFYLIDARDLDEAISWAGKMPHIPRGGTVEVRPVMEFDTN